ncbi:ATP-dependent DNA helicase RecG [Candidatus Ruminimicrobium bovinum]|uniref:ATP-dependent DNA helicase RecG n=1 Tax=Candidatus Ruminimicrobium bovinum TaxID=3242779 RepID=UPI0039B96D46
MNLYENIQFLKGIGPKRAKALNKLNIKNIADLLTFFPRAHQDRNIILPILSSQFSGHKCIFGKITNAYTKKLSKNLAVFCIDVSDNTGTVTGEFFRKISPYSKYDIFENLRNNLSVGKYVYLYGIQNGIFKFSVEDFEIIDNPQIKPLFFKRLLPVYNLTSGINQKFLLNLMLPVVTEFAKYYPDIVPQNIMPVSEAIYKLHFPNNKQEYELARQTFALQEFFILQLMILIAKNKNGTNYKAQKYQIKKTLLSVFKQNLTFDFTKAQKKAINEIFNDMLSSEVMNRMLMGDVGSGKTVVALSAILLAIENGYQAAIIAPTEILAEQHFLTFGNLLKNLNIKIDLVTSSILKKIKQKDEILNSIATGKTNIIIGTHSVMEDRVKFKNISLVVIDEQHRFGVMQKVSALAKGATPDVLMMTATPIPRGLAMTIYGEIDVSIIDQLPPGRIPIKTTCVTENEAYKKVSAEISKKNQAYIVYPLVDESDKTELKSAVTEAENLSKTVFKNFKVGLLHGKMKPKEKNEVMTKFKNKNFDILISTTVIEVGIDIPDATVMVIEHADRFGLATLHQLRGRVGRSKKQSYCMLVSDSKSKKAKQRLSVMTQTNDGFKIASHDLDMRGPGDFIGTKQHGFPEFKAGNIIKDLKLIELAKEKAAVIIQQDPELKSANNNEIKNFINNNHLNISKIIQVG